MGSRPVPWQVGHLRRPPDLDEDPFTDDERSFRKPSGLHDDWEGVTTPTVSASSELISTNGLRTRSSVCGSTSCAAAWLHRGKIGEGDRPVTGSKDDNDRSGSAREFIKGCFAVLAASQKDKTTIKATDTADLLENPGSCPLSATTLPLPGER